MPSILHAWFDCDGTLYEQPPELLQQIDSSICEGIAKKTRKSLEEITRDYKRRRGQRQTKLHIITSYGFSKEQAYEMYDGVLPQDFIEADPRLGETFVELLGNGVAVSIFSNSRRSKLYGILAKLGLNIDWFTFLMTGEEVPAKPAIDGYLQIIERSRCSPGAILFAGDNERADIVPARNVGMNTFFLSPESSMSIDEANKTYHFKRNKIYEIVGAIREIKRLDEL